MKSQIKSALVRRSIALPKKLVDEAKSVAPSEIGENFNRLVIIALENFTARRKKRAFEEIMNQMGSDPEILNECRIIKKEFLKTEKDGLNVDD
ncbi:MAG: hypothetical protein HY787_25660 [Deltaproteobacteria bacterium]|nr:hypothetical protein [Deltaproteobacteria bacterium]